MNSYERSYPRFSLCGLNCGLCPQFHSDGASRCPGCGGENFSGSHPTCPVVRCSLRHGGVEYCFQCESYPCERYRQPLERDSFITYRRVPADLERVRDEGLAAYARELDEKVELLRFLLEHCNDGRRKRFYCTAVNLLPLEETRALAERIRQELLPAELPPKACAVRAAALVQARADELGLSLKLRK